MKFIFVSALAFMAIWTTASSSKTTMRLKKRETEMEKEVRLVQIVTSGLDETTRYVTSLGVGIVEYITKVEELRPHLDLPKAAEEAEIVWNQAERTGQDIITDYLSPRVLSELTLGQIGKHCISLLRDLRTFVEYIIDNIYAITMSYAIDIRPIEKMYDLFLRDAGSIVLDIAEKIKPFIPHVDSEEQDE